MTLHRIPTVFSTNIISYTYGCRVSHDEGTSQGEGPNDSLLGCDIVEDHRFVPKFS